MTQAKSHNKLKLAQKICLLKSHQNYKELGVIRAKTGPTSDVDNFSSKIYSQYVLFRNKYK
jgi:hypothetical protein